MRIDKAKKTVCVLLRHEESLELCLDLMCHERLLWDDWHERSQIGEGERLYLLLAASPVWGTGSVP